MFVTVFKSNHRIVTLFVLVLTAVLCIPHFQQPNDSSLFNMAPVEYVIAVALICFQAIFFNRLINREKLVENNTYLTSLFIVLFNCTSFVTGQLNMAILANTFVVLGITQLFVIYNEKHKMAQVFNAALLFGIATVIHHPFIIWLPLVFILVFYLTTPVWRDIAVLFLGYGLPVLYVLVYHFFTGGIETLSFDRLNKLQPGLTQLTVDQGDLVFWIILAVLCVPACLFLFRAMAYGVVKVRKLLWSIVFVGLVGVTTLFLDGGNLSNLLVVLSLPLAVLMANFFERFGVKWLSECLFFSLLIGMAWIYFS